jgi:signal transduction histidine kinase
MTARVDHLEKFINDIADYSRNRTQAVIQRSINVKKLLNDVLDSVRYLPGASEMLIQVEVDERMVVAIDGTRLQIILSNLISNAIKYRDTSKERSLVMIRLEHSNDNLILFVEDNGIGIPKEFITKIFDMYVRAHEHSQGSGLGLYIMKEAVDKLGGSIHVESEVSGGTSFKVSLPALPGIADTSEAQSLPA